MRPTAYLLLCSALVACGPSGRGDDVGGGDDTPGTDANNGSNGDNCSEASKLVYVVDANNQLSQFDPSTKTFKDLGSLTCQAPSGYSPFSMGVDRNATAYVLYVKADALGDPSDSKLFRVDTTAAGLPCTATTFTPNPSMKEFGMGFSTDTAGGTTDKLYIAGSNDASTTSNAMLATLDVSTFAVTMVQGGTIQGSPELTGNSNAELWGFFPDPTNPKIQGINKASGGAITPAPLPSALKGQPAGWAFAFYGGDYWIFLAKTDGLGTEMPTSVYQVSPAGALKSTTPTTNRKIVGAGVSTCAPVVIL